jgi:excisionase family DNA binding protein
MTLAARRRGFVGPNWRYLVTLEFPDRLLTPGEVALLFRVDPKTVTRWASSGRIGSIRTPGGHRRFRESEVNVLLADLTFESSQSTI